MTWRNRGNDRGSILVLTALMLTAMLSIAAVSLNASYAYDKRNRLHSAADAAALAAARELQRDPAVSPNLQTYANHEVALHMVPIGITTVSGPSGVAVCPPPGSTGQVAVCVNYPPVNGPFAGITGYVEVIASERTNTFFSGLLALASLNPGARAVAGSSPSQDCIVTFNHIEIALPSAGSLIIMPNCSMTINGVDVPSVKPHDLDNNGTITARGVGVVDSGSDGCVNNCVAGAPMHLAYGVPPAPDPLITLPALADPDPGHDCSAGPFVITANITINPAMFDKYYCGWTLDGGVLTLSAGNYYIDGPIRDINSGTDLTIVGDGVMIYMTAFSGGIKFKSNHVQLGTAAAPLTAPTSGPYNGILFYQNRGAPINNHVEFGKNITDMWVRGAFYFPRGTLLMKNMNSNAMTNPCTLIVSYGIEIDKPVLYLDNACLGFGGSPLLTATLAE